MVNRLFNPATANFRRILYPTKFSVNDAVALGIARSLARDAGAELIIAHVADGRRLYDGGEYRDEVERRIDLLRRCDPPVHATTVIVAGSPASEIVGLSRDLDCDLIVIRRSRRRWGVGRIVESLSQRVERLASCSVVRVVHRDEVHGEKVAASATTEHSDKVLAATR